MTWWRDLGERDRTALLIGTVLLAVTLLYLLAWEPLATHHARLDARVAEQREQLAWMEKTVREVSARPAARRAADPPASGASLLGVIDQTASSSGLKSAVKRVAPEGEDRVRVWLGEAPYPAVLRWIEALEGQGLALQTLQVERHETPGRIEARVLVGRKG